MREVSLIKDKKKQFLFISFLFIVTLYPLKSQNLCERANSLALEHYQMGRFSDVEEVLKNCISILGKEEKIKALKLLTLKNLHTDNIAIADSTFIRLLSINPSFEINEKEDPIELQYYYRLFRTYPIVTIGFQLGANVTNVNILQSYSVGSTANSISSSYHGRVGSQVGLSIERRILNKLEMEIQLSHIKMRYEKRSRLFDIVDFHVTETQDWIGFPLYMKYSFTKRGIIPYLYAGYMPIFLINADASIERNTQETLDSKSSTVSLLNPDLRVLQSQNVIYGGGVKIKVSLHHFIIDVRWSQGLSNVVNGDNRYAKDEELIFSHGQVDDDFSLNNLSISSGFVFSFFKPARLKESKKNNY